MKKYIILLSIIALPILLNAQLVKHDRILSFESDGVPPFISAVHSQVSISDAHYKDGNKSLRWSFKKGGELIISKDLHFEEKDMTGKDTYLSTFVVWVYNAVPADDNILFEFYKDNDIKASFPFHINFKGWRAAWVSYERDMQGKPEEGMNQIRIKAPLNSTGELYFDQIVTAAKADHRHHTPDIQVPFVNKETNSHWLKLLSNSTINSDMELTPLTESQIKDIEEIEKKLKELIYRPSVLTEKEIQNIEKEYTWFQIKNENGTVSGLPVFYGRANEIFERLIPDWQNLYPQNGMEVRKLFDLMQRTAVAYHNAQDKAAKERLKGLFLNMYLHATDQGIAYGSGLGNITHFGYSFRGLYTAYYLMKDVLRDAGYLEEAVKTLQWYAMTNETFIKPIMNGMDMDSFNTTTTGRICSILIMEDSPEKVRYLKSFSRWINNGCLPAPGLAGSFKIDGAAFHHCNLYPAYAVGGLDGATNMIYLLSKTSFSVSREAHETVKNVLLAMRFYCNKKHFPLSLSGRHPDGRGELVPIQYARLAMAGSPDLQQDIDKELGAAYLRLITNNIDTEKPEYVPKANTKVELELADNIRSRGINPENDPAGNLSLNYGCVAVQRQKNWAAVVRGHSRYLWAAEHYIGANLYGRYLAHGSMQILTAKGNTAVTPLSSGWQQEGFDWGRIPGATAIHLPVEQLKANVLNVDNFSGFEEMLYSDEAFAGSVSHRGTQGNFGMILHEHDKYNGSHKAHKSYHFLGDKIVCLGSDIENNNSDYDTETTIFQLAITNDKDKDFWRSAPKRNTYWLDHLATGYYIPKNETAKLSFENNANQLSRKQNTGEETSGSWVTLTRDHGKAPQSESYEYVVIPQTTEKNMDKFSKNPSYKVVQKDKKAHIVRDLSCDMTSYVLFEKAPNLSSGIIQATDTSCLIITEEKADKLYLTVCNPDLALYRGASDDVYDKDGKRIERSIYSRPWIFDESQVVPVTITLKGLWKTTDTEKCKVIESNKKETILQFLCKDGASIGIELQK